MISGLLVLNKPSGISSGEFIRKLKPFIDDSKIGHSGTLDPLASGVILACMGQMTRFTNFLANERKTYIAEMMFGIQTDTCLLYTSPSPRDPKTSRMPSSA